MGIFVQNKSKACKMHVFIWTHTELEAENPAEQRQLITTVVIPVIYNLGSRFYQDSKYKEILTVLDFFIVYPSSQLVQGPV